MDCDTYEVTNRTRNIGRRKPIRKRSGFQTADKKGDSREGGGRLYTFSPRTLKTAGGSKNAVWKLRRGGSTLEKSVKEKLQVKLLFSMWLRLVPSSCCAMVVEWPVLTRT